MVLGCQHLLKHTVLEAALVSSRLFVILFIEFLFSAFSVEINSEICDFASTRNNFSEELFPLDPLDSTFVDL
jgi:hypothetical protein